MFAAAVLCAASSCDKSGISAGVGGSQDVVPVEHGEIVLGQQLENPYSLENVKAAVKSVYPNRRVDDIVHVTDLYVRFLPSSDSELSVLKGMCDKLMDHPLDFEIMREGDFYHDKTINDDEITWQYAVVPTDFKFPPIAYEILEDCCIIDSTDDTKAVPGVDWDAVEEEAYRLSGNGGMVCAGTKGAGSVNPSGRITIVDDNANGGQPFGVAGVEVQCNAFVKFSSTYTDRDGYYEIPKKFTANPRYRLVFSNSKGFGIGLNTILFPASVSTLGRNSPEGVSIQIDHTSDRKMFRRSVVNNAVYDFIERCSYDDLDITAPASNLRIWMFDSFDASSAVMLHHGTVLDAESSKTLFKIVSAIVTFFSPDITIGSKNLDTYKDIYLTTVHELAHASHFAKVGKEYWDKYIIYIASCALRGQDMYGDGSLNNAGCCAVGEMWAYYMENRFSRDRYGEYGQNYGSSYWFHPQILTYLEERGLTASQIFAALDADVTDTSALKERLIELNPSSKTSINQIFNRYE